MNKNKDKNKKQEIITEYKYGFNTKHKNIVDSGYGLNEEVIKLITTEKKEPSFMSEIRLNAYHEFTKLNNPKWGPKLDFINFNDFKYFLRASDNVSKSWKDVPKEIKDTFDKLGIIEAEQKFLAGVSTQFESEAVYHSVEKELSDLGIIYLDTDSALKYYSELFKKYFATIVPASDNKYAALNTAVWSGGSFIYVPKGVKLTKPIQSYFRMNSKQFGQFERTLIILDEDAEINYVEGCTAPIYEDDNMSLHAAVVEIYLHKNAHLRYTTIQNWSNNVLNLVTKRAICMEGAHMEWIDGNMGSHLNMKYPACILKGDHSKGTMISIAVANNHSIQDAGAKMIHLGNNTSSSIISKSISSNFGWANYRGIVKINEDAKNTKTHIECDTLLLDDNSFSDTYPTNINNNSTSYLEHEASVSKINEDQLFYLMSRGLSRDDATQLIIMGFIEPFSKELPMEYAVELNRLIKLNMDGSIG